ncbi:hypothetical protein ASG67_15820 [Sphingomonas sp. Leaf339]|nr:hypothetical protein ASG67_15820 [Sphingomonas sp. Leaf339]
MAIAGVSAITVGAAVSGGGDRGTRDQHASISQPAIVADGTRIRFPTRPLAMPDGGTRPVRSLLNTRGPMRFGDFRWNEDGVPIGTTWIRVDLSKQLISVFRGEHEIGTAIVLYGTDGKPTPTGTFPILARATHHRSSLYDAEMPYMLRLTRDGVAIHASAVRAGAATHGCIGVPQAFARHLYASVRRGDPVSILPAA